MRTIMEKNRKELGICELCGKVVYDDQARECLQWHDGLHVVHMWHNGTEERYLTWKFRLMNDILELV